MKSGGMGGAGGDLVLVDVDICRHFSFTATRGGHYRCPTQGMYNQTMHKATPLFSLVVMPKSETQSTDLFY